MKKVRKFYKISQNILEDQDDQNTRKKLTSVDSYIRRRPHFLICLEVCAVLQMQMSKIVKDLRPS